MTDMGDAAISSFGRAAIAILDALFPRLYSKVIVFDPTYGESGMPNILPQFQRGEFFAISSLENPILSGLFNENISSFIPENISLDESLDVYRYNHAIFACKDLNVLTAWSQAEYAVMAFKGRTLEEYSDWLNAMREIAVVRQID